MRIQYSPLFLSIVASVMVVLSGGVGGASPVTGSSSAVSERGSATQLLSAVDQGDLPEVSRLVAAGADVNMEEKVDVEGWPTDALRKSGLHGLTPVALAALKGHTDIVRVLVDAGADMDLMTVRPSNGKRVELVGTALMAAAREGQLDVARLLIERGADVMASWQNINALITAADKGNLDMAALLVAAGAYKPGSLNGIKALQRAKAKGHTEVAELLQAGFDEYVTSGALRRSFLRGFLKRLREKVSKDPESEFHRKLLERMEQMESQ